MKNKGKQYDVAAYVWPSYTGDEPRAYRFWEEGYGEWQTVHNVKENSKDKPSDYVWDRRPLWGYVNEANPDVMQMQIDCAVRHGVNVFIYDWYWYENSPFLENCLNDGFLKARNCDKMRFYLMWANHDAGHLWDINNSDEHAYEPIWSGSVDMDGFKTVVARWIEKYFTHPSYYKIDGKPVISIYKTSNFIKGFNGIDGAKKAVAYLRGEVERAGLPGVHLQFIHSAHESFYYDGRFGDAPCNAYEKLGFDSVTFYNPGTLEDRMHGYDEFIRVKKRCYDEMDKAGVLFFPEVSVGWDTNPRFRKLQPEVMTGNTPDKIKEALLVAREYVDTHDLPAPLVTVNSWNEWTETSYLQPDNLYGYGYLEAVREVFLGEAE